MRKVGLLILLANLFSNSYELDLNKNNEKLNETEMLEQINRYFSKNKLNDFQTNIHFIAPTNEQMISYIKESEKRQLESASYSLQVEIVMLVFWQLIFGQIIKMVSKALMLPYTPLLTIFGVIIGVFHVNGYGPYKRAITLWANIDPHILLILFMPALIFESAFNSDWHIFRMQFGSILYSAGPLLLVCTGLSAFAMRYIFKYDGDFTVGAALLFGAIVSATDPVAVVALLKELGTSKKLSTLIEGESLFNDGTAYVIFLVLLQIVQGKTLSVGAIILMFLRLSLGGLILGLVFGFILSMILKFLHNDSVLECNSTIVCCYLVFYIAEGTPLHVSGILALVALGLYMTRGGKTNISVNSEASLHHVWQTIGYSAETIIFILSGVIIGETTQEKHITLTDYLLILPIWAVLMLIRLIAYMISYPLIKKMGYGVNIKQCLVLSYSGLRGAVGLCLALIVKQSKIIDHKIRDIIIFHTGMIALCTLVINAMTIKYLIEYLGLSKVNFGQIQLYNEAIEYMENQTDRYIKSLQNQECYIKVDWNDVEKSLCLKPLLKQLDKQMGKQNKNKTQRIQAAVKNTYISSQGEKEQLKIKNSRNSKRLANISRMIQQLARLDRTDYEMLNELRNRYLTIVKSVYYEQFENGELMADSLIILNESIDSARDALSKSLNDSEFVIFYLNSSMNVNSIKFLYKMPKCVLKLFQKNYFEKMAIGYDVLLNYIEAHKEADHVMKEIVKNQKYFKKIWLESDRQTKIIQSYMTSRFEDHFPEVVKAIQIRRAQNYLINHQHKMVEIMLKKGQIDSKQSQAINNQIDIIQSKIVNNVPEIELNDDADDIVMYSDLNKVFTNSEIKTALKQSSLVQYLPSQDIENDKQSLIFISRGQILEYIVITENLDTQENEKQKTSQSIERSITQDKKASLMDSKLAIADPESQQQIDRLYLKKKSDNQSQSDRISIKKGSKVWENKVHMSQEFELEYELPRQKMVHIKGQVCCLRNLLSNNDSDIYEAKFKTFQYGISKVVSINVQYLKKILEKSQEKQMKLWRLLSYRMIYFNIFRSQSLSLFEDWSVKNIQLLSQDGDIKFYHRGQTLELDKGGIILQGSMINNNDIKQSDVKKVHSTEKLDNQFKADYKAIQIRSVDMIRPDESDSSNYVVTSDEMLVVQLFGQKFISSFENDKGDLQQTFSKMNQVKKKIVRGITLAMNNNQYHDTNVNAIDRGETKRKTHAGGQTLRLSRIEDQSSKNNKIQDSVSESKKQVGFDDNSYKDDYDQNIASIIKTKDNKDSLVLDTKYNSDSKPLMIDPYQEEQKC